MRVTRKYSIAGADPYSMVQWVKRSSRITNPDGSVVFEMKDAEVPSTWSQLATDIMVSKYFRKAGVPQDGGGTGPEKSARQVIHRLAGCWRHWGESHGYFDTTEDAQAFYDELAYMMVHQMAAPNSPQWFNTGLNWAYGITGPAQGHFIADPQTGDVSLAADAYTHPQPHACFIQSVSDDLVNEGGIMDLWVREARLFKYGSGTGTNFSSLRAENEPLSGGGKSSGLMSWLKIGDRAAGAIKSGGTTRRAAKMVCLDMDHPDIETFVNWKVREEVKVAAMVEGLKRLKKTDETIRETADRLGLKLDYDFNGEAYATVSGQNSNNSIRIPDAFFEALDADKGWDLRFRTNDQIARTVPAKDLWEQIGYAAWRCADPGVQYDSTINAWHTCPEGGRINASNPCVTGDTLVATETGLRRIRDMVGQSATIINGDGNAVFIDRIFKTGVKPVYELKTRAGYRVRLTADHRVKTANRGDVPACELTVDDVLLLEKSGFGDEFLPEAFGELLGAAVGDGCITRGERQDHLFITLGEHEREVARRLHENLNECKRWLNEGDGRGVRETEIVETQTGLRISTSVRPLLDRMRKYAVLDAGSGGKAFTDAVFGLDRAGVAATLRGLFTADGGVANYGEKSQYVFLDSTSLELLRQTQLLLLGFGIKAKIYENRRAIGQDKAMLPDGKGGMREYVVQQMHSLRISRASRIVFEKEIGFLAASAKARQLAELNQRVGVYADSMTDRVASLTACGVEEVFDLTEPVSHHFVANGVVVHNCSEYMFLDDTACNLASINLLKFYDSKTRAFDVEKYEHAVDIWTIVLEISVLMASFPSETIARKSYEYRTLGLGYANIGAMLMQAGIPYDSDDARALTGALTSIMCGRSYRKSAEMAAEMGPFAKYGENREHMLRVIRNHRRASKGMARDAAGKDSYERLKIRPVPIDHELFKPGRINIANAPELLDRSTAAWDDALALGEKHGYRNAQVTVIAPTGTIGLLMDCDTTGVEPDFALVKFKKLAGGGYFKIANASLRPALDALGYGDAQAKDIMRYVLGALTLDVPMPDPDGEADDSAISFAEFLREKGMLDADLKAVEDALPGVFELKFAFNAWTIGDAGLKRLGIDANKAKADPAFNLLSELGLTRKQIEALNEVICGAQTVEGAPGLKKEHLPVFDCASACGRKGKRFIAPEGHIRMMAAAQPFISGAISKTINLPNQASVEDIKSAYRLSWELGLKANALYRDGCKLSQPLSSKSDDESDESAGDADDARAGLADAEVRLLMGEDEDDLAVADAREESAVEAAMAARAAGAMDEETTVKIVERIVHRPLRRRLPDTRRSLTHKFNIAGHEGYLTVGLYEDGMPGELFITMAKEGSTIGGLMDSLGTAVSVALQYGVPVESLVNKFAHQRFEPAGMTTNRDIPFAKSLVDYIFRWLGMEFVAGYREAVAPKRSGGVEKKPAESAGRGAPGRLKAAGDRFGTAAPGGGNGSTGGEQQPRPARQQTIGAVAFSGESMRTEVTDESGAVVSTTSESHVLSVALRDCQGDAPACEVCGTITVRNGACYKCLNCGHSMGCS